MLICRNKALCWAMSYLLVVSPVFAVAQEASNDLLKYVHDKAAFAAIAHPRKVLTSPEMAMLPNEIFSAVGKKELGIDPLAVESILVTVQPPTNGPPAYGIVVRFNNPFKIDNLSEKILELTEMAKHNGREIRRAKAIMGPWLYMPDSKTLLIAGQPAFDQMLASSAASESAGIASHLQQDGHSKDILAVLDVKRIRPLITASLQQVPPVPPPLEPLKQIPDLVDRIDIQARIVDQRKGSFVLTTPDDESAKKLQQIIQDAFAMGRLMIKQEMMSEIDGNDPVQIAAQQYFSRMIDSMFVELSPKRDGNQLMLSVDGGQSAQVYTIGVLVALLLPAINAAREAARRNGSMNQMRQLSIAMNNHEAAYGVFPARANFDSEGKPLLSWRVHLLPFLEEQELYKMFRLDEPWDSDHNKKLIEQMPGVYQNPNLPEDGTTNYLVAVGPGTLFEGKQGIKTRQIKDGTSKTILMVEANPDQAVPWTKPADLKFDPKNPLNGLGDLRPGGFLITRCDASAQFIANTVGLDVLRALMTYAEGDVVDK